MPALPRPTLYLASPYGFSPHWRTRLLPDFITALEALGLGAAIALGKPVFLYRDDFRRCSDSEDYPLNLMVFSGLPQQGWQDYLYGAIDELSDPRKALVRWLGEKPPGGCG